MSPRSKSSARWLERQQQDPYVKRAQKQGARSRSVFKLEELDRRDGLLKAGMVVVDLGAAPGGWSDYAQRKTGAGGRVIALDILPMEEIAGVTFIQGDFREDEPLKRLESALEGAKADLVLSDMAPNMSGMRAVDQPKSMHLAELALAFAREHLKPGGSLLMKLFQGEGSDQLLKELKTGFNQVVIRKPPASRSQSREIYALARGLKA